MGSSRGAARFFCRLANVIGAKIELLPFRLGVEFMQVIPRFPHGVSPSCFLLSQVTHGCERPPKIPRASLPSIMTKLFPGVKYFQAAATAPSGSGITEQERLKSAPSSGPGNSNCRTVLRFTMVSDPFLAPVLHVRLLQTLRTLDLRLRRASLKRKARMRLPGNTTSQ